MDRLCTSVTQSFFLQNLWLAMLTAQSARAPALNYLARRLPKLSGDEGKEHPSLRPQPVPVTCLMPTCGDSVAY
jgi:hypothetical protein